MIDGFNVREVIMPKWVEIGEAEGIASDGKACLTAEEVPVVVCRVDGKLSAFRNMCPHAGLPLGEGNLQGRVLTCPFHGYAYDVETGKNVDFEGDTPLSACPLRVTADGQVEIDVDAD